MLILYNERQVTEMGDENADGRIMILVRLSGQICVIHIADGFGGLMVRMLVSGTRVRGFKPGQSRWIFRASEKSSACLPSEGK